MLPDMAGALWEVTFLPDMSAARESADADLPAEQAEAASGGAGGIPEVRDYLLPPPGSTSYRNSQSRPPPPPGHPRLRRRLARSCPASLASRRRSSWRAPGALRRRRHRRRGCRASRTSAPSRAPRPARRGPGRRTGPLPAPRRRGARAPRPGPHVRRRRSWAEGRPASTPRSGRIFGVGHVPGGTTFVVLLPWRRAVLMVRAGARVVLQWC